MTIELNAVLDANLNDPKGSNAASSGEVYVADGAAGGAFQTVNAALIDSTGGVTSSQLVSNGSGGATWKKFNGWANIADSTYTSGSPFAVTSTTRTLLPNDGAGSATDSTRLAGIWASNKIAAAAVAVGDAYEVRVIFKCQAAGTSQDVLIEFDIGGSVGSILGNNQTLIKGSGATNNIVIAAPVFVGSTFNTNGMEVYVTPSANMDFWDMGVVVVKHYAD